KDFYNVMRKFYPNENGTVINGTWTNTQTQTLTYAIKIPAYIYQISELAFVGWIQDDATKNVKQAGYSAPLPSPLDAGVTAINSLGNGCTATFTPSVTLQNFGTSTLTTCIINYQLNAGPVNTYSWSGSLASNSNTSVTLPSQTALIGQNVFT